MNGLSLSISILSLLLWLGLIGFRGQFWRSDQCLEDESLDNQDDTDLVSLNRSPSVCAVIPARNEADLLPLTVRSLLNQTYPGLTQIIVVDDHSTDGTAEAAEATAAGLNQQQQLQVITAAPLPPGWTGKLWAMDQGIQAAQAFSPEYLLLSDADIEHDAAHLHRLITKAIEQDLSLASVMVRLQCSSFWEWLLIPAFVFFFEKLYPFRWVNDPANPTAAAAGGCILIRRDMLDRIGGIQVIRQALIDDCALAQAVKTKGGRIWLGLSDRTRSLRPYPSLATIWDMVARTAFTQLNYSPVLLLGTLLGMALIYLVPPIELLVGLLTGNATVALIAFTTWLLMTLAYWPTVRFYRGSFVLAACLPIVALLYTLMTIDSALRHWQGRGGGWKGRVYSNQS